MQATLPTPTRKFYLGDKVEILSGPYAGRILYVCGKSDAEGYICCGVAANTTVRFLCTQARIISR